jgi:hypothetical protein
LETLHSLQDILFPSNHEKSVQTLVQLVKKNNFDCECLQYDGYIRFRDLPDNFTYVYWGHRLAKLHDLTFQKGPRNKLERWFGWYATEGNALLVALLALLISIIVGILSILLAILQTWIAWQAWKNPVVSNSPASTQIS